MPALCLDYMGIRRIETVGRQSKIAGEVEETTDPAANVKHVCLRKPFAKIMLVYQFFPLVECSQFVDSLKEPMRWIQVFLFEIDIVRRDWLEVAIWTMVVIINASFP